MILIFSQSEDVHARAVMAELDRLGERHVLVDLGEYPNALRLQTAFGPGGATALRFTHPAFGTVELGQAKGCWWRRPQPYRLDPAIRSREHQHFALAESYEAMLGTLYALDSGGGGVRWVNHPLKDDAAHRKVLQLKAAREAGLEVPDTLVTNDPAAARAFIAARHGRPTVYKAFQATEMLWRETRLLRQGEEALLDNVRFAPVIFQDYVEAVHDLRVTVVGGRVFPAAIHSQETSYRFDFRMDMARARISAAELPEAVQAGLLRLMRALGLVYGAIDMRRTPDGRYVFLEVNPAGQWLFVEQPTGLRIARAVAEELACR